VNSVSAPTAVNELRNAEVKRTRRQCKGEKKGDAMTIAARLGSVKGDGDTLARRSAKIASP
jgi:hypothetical protein